MSIEKYTCKVLPDNTYKGKWMVCIDGDRLGRVVPMRNVSEKLAKAAAPALSYAFGFGADAALATIQHTVKIVVNYKGGMHETIIS